MRSMLFGWPCKICNMINAFHLSGLNLPLFAARHFIPIFYYFGKSLAAAHFHS